MRRTALLIGIAPWILLFLIPVLALFLSSDLSGTSPHLRGWTLLFDALLIRKVQFTLIQSFLVVFASVLVGAPLGWALRSSPRASSWLKAPFGIPTLVAASAWVSILSGTRVLYSVWGVLIAHVVFNIPWIAFSVAEASRQVSRSLDELSQSLGAGRLQRWREIYFPVIGPSLFAGAAQVFIFCSMSFTLVMILGGGPPVETLETAIFSSIRAGTFDLFSARAFAIWQLFLSIVPWLVIQGFFSQKKDQKRDLQNVLEMKAEPIWHYFLAMIWIFPYFFFLKDLQWGIFKETHFWLAIRDPLILSFEISVLVACLSVIWAFFLGLGLRGVFSKKLRSILEWIVVVPAGMSTLTLSMGFWFAYSAWVDPFEGSLLAVILVQAFVFSPLVFRWIWPYMDAGTSDHLELAASLGASQVQAWIEVEWPRLQGPIFHCFSLVCAASLGELAIVSLFSSGKIITLPLVISRWMIQYQFDDANAAAAVLFVFAVLLARGATTERTWFNQQRK